MMSGYVQKIAQIDQIDRTHNASPQLQNSTMAWPSVTAQKVTAPAPGHDDGPGAIEFCVIDDSSIDAAIIEAADQAVAFAKADFNCLPSRIEVRWFTPRREYSGKAVTVFGNVPNLMGTIDCERSDVVYVRAGLCAVDTQKVALHEAFHLAQIRLGVFDGRRASTETAAYDYMRSAILRLFDAEENGTLKALYENYIFGV